MTVNGNRKTSIIEIISGIFAFLCIISLFFSLFISLIFTVLTSITASIGIMVYLTQKKSYEMPKTFMYSLIIVSVPVFMVVFKSMKF